MPIEMITGLSGAGLNTDIIPYELPPNYLTSCTNVRSNNGGIEPFGGHSEIKDLPAGAYPRSLLFISGNNTKFWIIACDDNVFKIESSVVSAKPDGMISSTPSATWSLTSIAGIPVMNSDSDIPYYMLPSYDKMKPLPWKKDTDWNAAKQSCKIMIAHKQFLFALGITNNGVYNSDGVRWSAPADIGGVPPTWDPLDTTSTAGYTTIGGAGGEIIGALPMRDALVIYRERGITIADYIGGRYVWRFRHLGSSVGLLSKDGVVDVNGTHYFLSDGDIYKTDGNSVQSIADKRIIRDLNGINKDHFGKSYAVHNPSKKEVLFCVPTANSTYPNKAYIYNYIDNSWFMRDLPQNVAMSYGLAASVSGAWDDLNATWNSLARSWAGDATTPFDNSLVIISPPIDSEPAKLSSIDSIIGFKRNLFDSIIERTDLAIQGLGQVTTIQRVFPHIQGDGTIYVQIGSQKVPNGPIQWKPAVPYNPSRDRKIDVRSTGVLHCYRIFADQVDFDFKVSGLDIEYVGAGTR